MRRDRAHHWRVLSARPRVTAPDPDPLMNEYKIEKRRIPVTVGMIGGERIAGDVFVQGHARHRFGPEEATDVLNDSEPFFPLATASGETLIVAKEQVAEAEAEIGQPDAGELATGAVQVMVELSLTTGTVHAGALYLELPVERPRLLDFLNYFSQRFLVLHTSDGARLINRRLVAYVRPLD